MRRAVLISLLLGLLAPILSAAAASAPLTGRYRIVSVAGADGFDIEKTDAEFSANGRFASTVGCNRIAGAPTISGAQLAFGPMMTTRMACPPPLDGIERAYLDALREVRSYKMSGATLALLGEDGETLVTLARASAK